MAKFRKKLISATEPLATAAGIRSPVEQLQDLNALSISVVTVCADTSGTDGGLADDTAINTAGGFVKITGTGFRNTSPTTIVYINGVTATYNYLSSTSIVVTVPAATAGTTASLIVFNGSTVGSIWAAGISYSGFPSWTTTAASNLGVVVSTQLVAVGDAPLVYTFVSGTLPPNCTISSSGLLSGTVTGVSTNAIYTFTVAVTDAQNQNVSQSIVYTLVVSDFYYRYTSLHISGDSNPTWITDASTNALAVTTTGSPQATIFSPVKEGYYGNSFNGSSDYLTLPSTAGLAMGTGDFTIEFWYYPLSGTNNGIFQLSTASGGFLASYTNTIALYMYNNNVGVYASGAATYGGNNKLLYNVWTHIALVRISGVTKVYINGVLDTAFASGGLADTTNYTGTYGVIGGYYSTSYLSNAYISNFRIVKGTAVYTVNFTPSATPLTAITNTVLLTCQSNRFIDNIAVPATITVAGTPKVVSSNPFNLPAGLAAYGSGYFNGTTDYVTIPNNALFYFGSGNYTVEAWVYPLTTGATSNVILNQSVSSATSNSSFYLGFATDGVAHYVSSGTGWTYYAAASGAYAGRWSHVAWVRNGDTIYAFINGTLAASTVLSAGFSLGNSTRNIEIGTQATTGYTTAYISNLRVVKGTAVYTAAFTPPTAPLTAITNTSLLTLQTNVPHNNSQFRDTSTNNFLVTRVGNPTQGSFSPFTKQYPYSTTTVGGSVYFDSTAGDYLNIADPTSTFNFGSGNFTVEAWVYSKGGQNVMIWGNGSSGNNWVAFYTSTSAEFAIAVGGAVPLDVLTGTNSIIPDQWSHVALVRNGDVFTIYINGIKGNSGTRAGVVPYYDATNTYFGGPRWPGDTASSNGYMSNLRIVKGTAVYTSNFTPSTSPLTAISGTVLLMPFTNAAVYDNTMLNNFETVGNAGVSTAVTKYGSASLKFNGSGNAIALPASANIAIGTGDFTIEMWVNASTASNSSTVGSGWPCIFTLGTSQGAGSIEAYIVSGADIYVSTSGGAAQFTFAASTLFNSSWNHFAITRSGTALKGFVNGAQVGSAVNSGNINLAATTQSWIAATAASVGNLNGYIDELRITKGYARYTAAFTPSSGAFSVSAPIGTSILPSKSLRFRASASAYLNRTPAVVSNQQTWTWSGWVKRGSLTSRQNIFGAADSGFVTDTHFEFYTADQLRLVNYVSSTQMELITTQVFRDPAAWYHIVVSVDTTQAASSNRAKIYVNGSQVTSFSTATYPSQNLNTQINGTLSHGIGRAGAFNGQYFDGEMAEVNFVDGLALDPTMFGAYSTYGQWLPVSYAGYQGANGFYLPFNAATTTTSANYLVVAGGGGGGVYGGGGAGAGGLRTVTGVNLDPTTVYAVTVGAGGAGATAYTAQGISGGNSTFNALTSAGGGGGGSDNDTSVNAGLAGGSGGGAALSYNLTWAGGAASPVTSPVQGYAGAGTTASGGSFYNASGGGGGAGTAGTTGSTVAAGGGYGNAGYGTSGNGGAGVASSISGTSVTYAGGGGGGGASTGAAWPNSYYVTAGTGGAGGGGNGTMVNSRGIAGTTNLGGGGGGGGMYAGGITGGGAGGSGVVIISYSGTQKFYGGNVTSVGGNTIHTFTTSGSLTGIFGDQSGNNNNWTPNNINVSTVGPTYDLLTDVPTLTSATAANYAVLNPLSASASPKPSDGNLTIAFGGTYPANVLGSIGVSTGKWYWEVGFAGGTFSNGHACGIAVGGWANKNTDPDSTATPYSHYVDSRGYFVNNSTQTPTSINFGAGDIIGIALNCDTNVSSFYKNNTLIGSAQSIESGQVWFPFQKNSSYTSLTQYVNFGQQPFTYTPPANFLALNTYNI